METFNYEDVEIRYHRSGAGAPLILLHNGGTSHAIWRDIIPLLEGFQIFAPDLLGFGASSKPGHGYTLDRHVRILRAFIEANQLAPVSLVGNCMGSATALAFTMRHPEAVQSLTLLNTLTLGTFKQGSYGVFYGLPARAPRLTRALGRLPLGTGIGRLAVRAQLGAHGRARAIHRRPETTQGYAHASQSQALLQILADLPNYAALDRFEPPEGFPPICTLWGLENPVLPAEQGRALVSTLRPARQEWLEGCGHLPMLERPERVAAILTEWLAESGPKPERPHVPR